MNKYSYIQNDTKLALSLPISADVATKDIMKLFMRHRRGFTLAETLITLTIIGVIAAMTVPTLVTNYTKHTYVTGLKKMHSQLQNALRMMPITMGCSSGDYLCAGLEKTGQSSNEPTEAFIASYTELADTFLKHFKVRGIVNASELPNYETLGIAPHSRCAQLDDGTTICTSTGIPIPSLTVDVNGNKQPNKMGRDRFVFLIANEPNNTVTVGTLIPIGSKLFSQYKNSNYVHDLKSTCTSSAVEKKDTWAAQFCSGRVLEEGKMDY